MNESWILWVGIVYVIGVASPCGVKMDARVRHEHDTIEEGVGWKGNVGGKFKSVFCIRLWLWYAGGYIVIVYDSSMLGKTQIKDQIKPACQHTAQFWYMLTSTFGDRDRCKRRVCVRIGEDELLGDRAPPKPRVKMLPFPI